MVNGRLAKKDYLQISTFPNLVIVEQKRVFHDLQKKATKKATKKVVKSWPAGHNQA